jgi:FKBP-type peptidyl-prolyl cis-trans isomerase
LSTITFIFKERYMKSSAIALLLGLGMLCANVYADNTTGNNMNNTTATTAAGTDAGSAFLNANKAKPGVVTLPDGLQYKIVTKGNGTKPTANDVVTVHYAGTLINGKEFDSSYKRGEPATFPVNGVIAGWTEALQLMPAGSTWELFIPASLAYGDQGAPPAIGPNETLIFKVQLISVKKG